MAFDPKEVGIWTQEERDSCREAALKDNPGLSPVELEVVVQHWLDYTEWLEHKILYGSGAGEPVGLLNQDTEADL